MTTTRRTPTDTTPQRAYNRDTARRRGLDLAQDLLDRLPAHPEDRDDALSAIVAQVNGAQRDTHRVLTEISRGTSTTRQIMSPAPIH